MRCACPCRKESDLAAARGSFAFLRRGAGAIGIRPMPRRVRPVLSSPLGAASPASIVTEKKTAIAKSYVILGDASTQHSRATYAPVESGRLPYTRSGSHGVASGPPHHDARAGCAGAVDPVVVVHNHLAADGQKNARDRMSCNYPSDSVSHHGPTLVKRPPCS